MILGSASTFEQCYTAVSIDGGVGYGSFKIEPGDVVGAGAGNEQATGTQHAKGSEIEFLVATESTLDGALAFSEGGRVMDDDVIDSVGFGSGFGFRHSAKDFEGVGLNPIYFCGELGAVGFEILLGYFQ